MKKRPNLRTKNLKRPQFPRKTNKFVFSILLIIGIVIVTKLCVNITYYYPDGVGYWIYLPTVWLDHDLDFSNNLEKTPQTMPLAITKTGYISNLWNVGTAVLLTPFFLVAQYFGFSSYLLFTNFGSTLYGILVCVLIYISLVHLGIKNVNAVISSLVAFFASPLFFYTYFLPQSAHPVSAFIVSFFLTYWLITIPQYKRISRWIFLGLIAGLMTMVRTQEIMFAVVIIIEVLFRWFKERNFVQSFKFISIFSIFTILGFTPQLLIWKFIYGNFISQPQAFNLSVGNFALLDVLFSPFHGILFWTPIIYFAIFGSIIYIRRNVLLSFAVSIPTILQILLISFITAWWGGYSFGIRYFANLAWPIGIGVGLILNSIENRGKIIKITAKVFLLAVTFWTFLLAAQTKIGKIDIYAPLNFEKFKNSVATFPGNMHTAFQKIITPEINFSYSQEFLIVVVLISLLIFWLFHKSLVKSKFTLINCSILVFLMIWDYNIVISHLNTNLPLKIKKEVIPISDLENLFLSYDLKYRIDYYRLVKNDKMVQKTWQRLQKIVPQTEYVKDVVLSIQEELRAKTQ